MGWTSLWADDVSRRLETSNKDAAGLWKASNLLLKPAIILFLIGSALLVVAVWDLVSSGLDFKAGSSILITAPLAGLVLLLSTALFCLYFIIVALLAAAFNEFNWAGFIFVFGVPAPYYKYKKGKELRGAR